MEKLTELAEWQELKIHQKNISHHHMRDWFHEDALRFQDFSLQFDDILLDYSKNRITRETLPLLCRLAEKTHLKTKIESLFNGHPINATEKRPALHTALRDKNPSAEIADTLNKMRFFIEEVRSKRRLG